MLHRALMASPAVVLGLFASAPAGWAQNSRQETVTFSETRAIVEINATDGDIGFHTQLNADAWKEARIADPAGNALFEERARGTLAIQGLTENTFESDEPLCTADPNDPNAKVVALSEFIERFPAGTYRLSGKTIENAPLEGTAELTHNLPAAPQILGFDGTTVTWQAGTTLGRCDDPELVSAGALPDPATVAVVAWEVVVEPADTEGIGPLRVFSVQLPAGAPTSVTVPSEFVSAYLAQEVTEFKVEIGAIEAGGNRTFSEQDFEVEL